MGMHAYPSQGTPTHLTQQFSSIQGTEQHVKAAFYDGSADAPVLDLPVVMLTALTVTVADDSRTPDAKSLNLLQQTVQKYKADRSAVLQIQAYMDVTAPDEGTARRKALGRAIAVRSHILEMGIPNYRISLEVIQPDLFAQNDTLVVAVMRDKQKAQRLAAWDARQQKRQAAKAAQQANSIPSPQTRAPQPAATPTLQQEIEQDAELTYAEDAIIQGGNDFSISVDETLQAPAADETRQSTYAPAATPFAQGAVVEVVFPPQSSQVPDAAKPMLDQLANMLSANADQRVILQAFASLPDGEPAQVARRLSLARAQSVRQYLKSLGIDNRRITMRALGNQGGPMAPDRVDVVLN
jgi:outer membrane protein OmpA-like peptidoglycan-associated protein